MKRLLAANSLSLVGIGLAIVYWLIEPLLDTLVDDANYASRLLPLDDPNELWMRLIIVGLLIGFSSYVQVLIARRERAENAVRDSEEKFRALVQNALDIVMVTDADGTIRYISPSVERVLGYRVEEMVGTRSADHIRADDLEKRSNEHAEAMPGLHPATAEARVRHKDGSWRHLEGTANDMLDNPVIRGMVFNYRDVTRRKRVEKALAEERNLLRTLIDNLPNYIYAKDTESRFIVCNVESVRLLKVSRWEEVVGKTDFDFFPKELAAQYYADEQEIVRSGRPLIGKEEPSADERGNRRWHSTTKVPLRDSGGEIVGIVGISRDVTERKLMEEALRKSEASLAEAQRMAHLGNWEWDVVTGEISWSDEVYRIHGFEPGESAPTFDKLMEAVHPDDRRSLREAIDAALYRDEPYGLEHRIVLPGGEVRIVHRRAEVVFDEAGKPLRMVGTVQDVTERKRAEQELRKRAAELARSNAELEQFAYSISHDLRAPLRSMDGFSQILLEDHGEELDESGRDYLRRVRAASQRMGYLIDDLLELSRVTRSEIHYRRVDLSALARGVAGELERSRPDRTVEFSIEDGLTAEGDSQLLGIALESLLSNGFKFTSKEPSAKIEFGAVRQGDDLTYYVRDNGVGFDMSYVDKLFAPFERLHQESEFEGTGVGLATVQRIVHRHGGRLWAEGEVGKGAAFYFTLG